MARRKYSRKRRSAPILDSPVRALSPAEYFILRRRIHEDDEDIVSVAQSLHMSVYALTVAMDDVEARLTQTRASALELARIRQRELAAARARRREAEYLEHLSREDAAAHNLPYDSGEPVEVSDVPYDSYDIEDRYIKKLPVEKKSRRTLKRGVVKSRAKKEGVDAAVQARTKRKILKERIARALERAPKRRLVIRQIDD